jgi:hypothetical protein
VGLQLSGKPLQEGLQELEVQVLHRVAGQGLMGGEGGLHEVLKQGLRLVVGEVEEGAEEQQGQVKAVVVAPGAAPLALGGGWSHLPGQAQAVFRHLLGACLPAKEASLAHRGGNKYTPIIPTFARQAPDLTVMRALG